MINNVYEDDERSVIRSPVTSSQKTSPQIPAHDYVIQKVRDNLHRNGDGVWLTDCSTRMNVRFSEIEPKSQRIGNSLWVLGLRPGNIVYFCTSDITSLSLLTIGVWSCNAAMRGGCPADTADDLSAQIRDSRSSFVVCDRKTADKVKTALTKVDWEVQLLSVGDVEGATSIAELLSDDSCNDIIKEIAFNTSEDVVYVFSTSGSTGLPKGAPHTHDSIVYYLTWEEHVLPKKSTMYTSANYHVTGFMYPFISLVIGVPAFGFSSVDPSLILESIQNYKPQFFGTFPTLAVWLSKTPLLNQYDLSSIQIIMASGATLDVGTLNFLLQKLPSLRSVQRMYGMSESIVVVSTVTGMSFTDDGESIESKDIPPESTGVLLPGILAKVVDVDTRKPLGPNIPGELLIKSPTNVKGYLNRLKESAALFEEGGFQRTGDLGYYDERGNIFIIERLKEIFKYHAHHISPSELEGALRSHPEVIDAGVTAVPDTDVGALPRAYVIKKPNSALSETELRLYMDERTSNYKHLRGGIIFVDSLPVLANGKLSRIGLRKFVQDGMK